MQDWNYMNTNCFELTVEIGCTKFPTADRLPSFWQANKFSLLVYMGQVHKGVRGFVIDEDTKQGIANASINIEGIEHTVTSAKDGDFWRLLAPGTHTVIVSAPHYETKSITVKVTDGPAVFVNFSLSPDHREEWSETNDFGIAANMAGTKYYSNHDLQEEFTNLANTYPSISTLNMAHITRQGKGVIMYHLSASGLIHDDHKPHILLLGGLNGDDPVGTEMLVRFARHLTTGYTASHPDCRRILDSSHVHIIPQVNIEGMSHAVPGDCAGRLYNGSRFNEMIAKKSLVQQVMQHKFHTVLSLEAEDEDIFQSLARSFADKFPGMYDTPCDGNSLSGVVHGADLPQGGIALADTLYRNYNSYTLSAYINCCKYPPASELPSLWQKSLTPLMGFLLRSQQGIHGAVMDESGHAIAEFSVQVDSKTVQQKKRAAFFLTTAPGPKTITVSAPGFESVHRVVTVDENSMVEANFTLTREKNTTIGYHNYTAMVAMLRNITTRCPAFANLSSIGKSTQGQDLWMLRLGTAHTDADHMPPSILLLGNIHGDDAVGREMLLQLSSYLCDKSTEAFEKQLLEEMVVYVVPSLNPDGARMATVGQCEKGPGHANSENIDLDTDFRLSGPDAGSAKETAALQQWMANNTFTLAIALEGGSSVVAYPVRSAS
nr:hypothetical protein BaRGS_002425 [Batillaria attramentaria]